MLIYRKWAAVLGMAMALMAGLAQAEDRPPVAHDVVAYSGEQGVKVWTLRIGERSEHQALVQLEGIDHDWNLRIQKMSMEKTSSGTRYFTSVDGNKYVVLVLQDGWGELYLPGEDQTMSISYDENLSRQGDAQAFLTDYLQAQ
ncbi:hypothetical protein SAMN05216588_11165 [Pseudomonas flavescens]|uniref:Uncharacterized protein n=1 Tax=Phytopseudomonas flavescens TaxID=29435 RepID=A0A1G8HR35_9GAMM|nr:hypothetical protein [Pseudomonas flavescens]SDI09099.1 hypothetical protein SAMN05216588_11165 [Pseudomonas flavescens]